MENPGCYWVNSLLLSVEYFEQRFGLGSCETHRRTIVVVGFIAMNGLGDGYLLVWDATDRRTVVGRDGVTEPLLVVIFMYGCQVAVKKPCGLYFRVPVQTLKTVVVLSGFVV